MEVFDVIHMRRSIRSYTGKPLTNQQINTIVSAANLSAVGMGKFDDLHLTIITDVQVLQKISKYVKGDNLRDPLHGAPALAIVSVKYPEKNNLK